ncbi:MAG: PAS domain S-box protein [Spirochaetes bacterium]|nr:PAS domain S-box protein [Spirochaetota bacterium]
MDLSENQESFTKILELSPILIFIHTDGVISYANSYTAALLAGGNRSIIIGQPLSRFINPDYHDLYFRSLALRKKSQDTIQYSKQALMSQDGSELFVRGSSTPIIFDGTPSILVICENITETNELMTALQDSEEKFRLLVESARDIIYKCTSRGDFVYMNPAGLEKLGYDPEILYRLNYTDIIPPELKAQEYGFYRDQLQKKTPETYHELPILKSDGTAIWFGQYVILTHDKGAPYFYGVARDITELRDMRISLEQSEKKYRNILENMGEGYFETDLDGRFTYLNNAAFQLSGLTREQLEQGIEYTSIMTPRTA